MSEVLTPDLCVIGAGAGGLSVAAAAAAFGVPVVLVEKGAMGGDCLNAGCVPSKALIAAAKRAQAMRDAAAFGIAPVEPQVDLAKVHAHVRGVIAAIAPNDSAERFRALGVRVIRGAARFKDAATVAVGDDVEIRARRTVIATGSVAAVPPIPGLADTPHLTNETVFDLDRLPAHLIVVGAGPIGLELAQAFRRLGAAVTVLEAARPLAKDDPECAAIVLDRLAQEGVVLRTGVKVAAVSGTAGRVDVRLDGPAGAETIQGSHLLVATGRRPGVAGLGLEAAGIAAGPAGIQVDKRLLTTNKRVYAIGDVAGGAQFTHLANHHAGLVIRHALFRLPVDAGRTVLPWVTYTDPEIAQVGPTEAEARQRHHRVAVLRWPFHENDRAQTERATAGHVKLVTSAKGAILGATIVGEGAGELAATWALAIGSKLNVRAIAGIILPYPTRAEAGKRAAMSYFTPRLTGPWVRRIIHLLRRFG